MLLCYYEAHLWGTMNDSIMTDTITYSLSDYDYDLPPERIAQYPLEKRTGSRMLVVDKTHGTIEDNRFQNLESFLRPNDLLVFNDTRVVPARLYGRKESGGKVECLVDRFLDHNRVLAHVKASKSPKPGTLLLFENDQIEVSVLSRQQDLFELQFPIEQNVFDLLKQFGHVPLPPYISRASESLDSERYQTVFAKNNGAVAAPTAGLHFDEATIERLKKKGVDTAYVTLHVGAGTFQPVRGDDLDSHHMHSESIEVSAPVCEAVARCRKNNGRVIAVGTTVCRCLEAASRGGSLQPYAGDTDLFIKQGFQFNCVDMLITNFHLPRSTLLVLVSAFSGFETIKKAYNFALNQQYRFFSYGDLMLIV